MKAISATLIVAGTLAGTSMALNAERSNGDSGPNPPPVYVGAKGEYVRATQGTYCYSDESPHEDDLVINACADAAYPLRINARLPVAGRQRLRIDAGRRAKRLSAALVRVEGDEFDDITYLRRVRTRRTGQGRFWKLRLPHNVEGTDVLSLDLDFGTRGDSNVWAGLTQREPGLAGYHRSRASTSTG